MLLPAADPRLRALALARGDRLQNFRVPQSDLACVRTTTGATLSAMRSEHKTTADEHDAFTGWRHVLVSMQRAGVRKALKQRSHRKDRRAARRRIVERDA